jgi:flavin reductase (DIM6/NTAB) family NADH-FMN oxidoreductase RutF
MAVSTFTPVSLDPPLISLCIQRTSTTWPRLRRAPVLGVSVLSVDHEHAGRQLSLKTGDRFASVNIVTVGSGAIHLPRSCAWFDYTLDAELPAGDHVIAVLRIVRSGVSERTAPLIFDASRIRRLADMPDPTSALERVHMLPAAATVPAALEEIRRGRPVVRDRSARRDPAAHLDRWFGRRVRLSDPDRTGQPHRHSHPAKPLGRTASRSTGEGRGRSTARAGLSGTGETPVKSARSPDPRAEPRHGGGVHDPGC